MSGLRCEGVTASGKALALPPPLSLELTRGYDTPADGLALTLPWRGDCPALASVALWDSGTAVFEGIVDEQRSQLGDRGLLTLQARSRAGAWAVDNEALPQEYRNPRLSEVFYNHLRPYGLLGPETDRNYGLARYVVPKGVSEWEAFSRFCLAASGRPPLVRGVRVVAGPPGRYARHVVSNRPGRGGIPFCSLQRTLRPAAVVSRYILRNDLGVYLSAVDNLAAPVTARRKRYLIPAGEYASRPAQDAVGRLAKSNLAYLSFQLELPGFRPILPLDWVELDLEGAPGGLFAAQVSHVQSAGGTFTRLVLADGRYLT